MLRKPGRSSAEPDSAHSRLQARKAPVSIAQRQARTGVGRPRSQRVHAGSRGSELATPRRLAPYRARTRARIRGPRGRARAIAGSPKGHQCLLKLGRAAEACSRSGPGPLGWRPLQVERGFRRSRSRHGTLLLQNSRPRTPDCTTEQGRSCPSWTSRRLRQTSPMVKSSADGRILREMASHCLTRPFPSVASSQILQQTGEHGTFSAMGCTLAETA